MELDRNLRISRELPIGIAATPNVNALCPCRTLIGEVDVARNPDAQSGFTFAVVADSCSRAIRVHHAGGQHARRSGPRVPIGHLTPAGNAGQRDRMHQRLALVRPRRRGVAWLGLARYLSGPIRSRAPVITFSVGHRRTAAWPRTQPMLRRTTALKWTVRRGSAATETAMAHIRRLTVCVRWPSGSNRSGLSL